VLLSLFLMVSVLAADPKDPIGEQPPPPEALNIFSKAPVAKITGPETGDAGEMAVFSSDGSSGKSYNWVVLPEINFHKGESNQSISVGTKTTGTYYVVLVATAGDKSVVAVHKYINGVASPEGPIKPVIPVKPVVPDVKPEPPAPSPVDPAWMELSKAARNSISQISRDVGTPDNIHVMAQNLRATAVAIKADSLRKDDEKAFQATKDVFQYIQKLNRTSLGEETCDKIRPWSTWLGNEMKKSKDRLKTPQDFPAALTAIAWGLDPR
jgi:hypothetical protein